METMEEKWEKIDAQIEKFPPFAAPITRKYLPQYKAASEKAYQQMIDAALQFAKEGESIILQMFDELKKEAARYGYGFAAIMKKEAEMKAKLAATRNNMFSGITKKDAQN